MDVSRPSSPELEDTNDARNKISFKAEDAVRRYQGQSDGYQTHSEVEDAHENWQSRLEMEGAGNSRQAQPEVEDADGAEQSESHQPWTRRSSYSMRERRPSHPEVDCVHYRRKSESEVEVIGDKQQSRSEKLEVKNAERRRQSQSEVKDAGKRSQSHPEIYAMSSRQQQQPKVDDIGSRRHSQLEAEDAGIRWHSQPEVEGSIVRPQTQPEVEDTGIELHSQLEIAIAPVVIDVVRRHQNLPEVVEAGNRCQSPSVMEGAGGRRSSQWSQIVPWTRRKSHPMIETQGRLSMQEVKASKLQYIKQIMYGIIVSSSQCMIGIMIGWPVIIPRLTEDQLSESQLSQLSVGFLVSCVFLSGMFTNLIAGYLVEMYGPRRLLLFAMPPVIISYIAQVLYFNYIMLFVGRMVVGMSGSIVMVVAQPLVAELCCPQIRGFLSSLPETFNALGLLLVYICSQHLSFRWVTGLCALPSLLTMLCLIPVPESPYWLVSKGNTDLAEKSIKDLYGDDYAIELMTLKVNIKKTTFKDQMKEISRPQNYRPVCLVIALFWIKECAGYQFIFSYAGHLFEESDVAIDSSWCPILIGLCRLIFSAISAVVVDWKGRRPLLVSSSAVCGLSLVVAGLTRYYGAHLSSIISVLVFTSSFGIGEGPIICMLNGELVPMAVRSIGTNWVIRTYFLGGFFATLTYAMLTIKFEVEVIFYICAFFNIVLAFVAWEFVPETRNASLFAVSNAYDKRRLTSETIMENNESILEIDETNTDHKPRVSGYDNLAMDKIATLID